MRQKGVKKIGDIHTGKDGRGKMGFVIPVCGQGRDQCGEKKDMFDLSVPDVSNRGKYQQ